MTVRQFMARLSQQPLDAEVVMRVDPSGFYDLITPVQEVKFAWVHKDGALRRTKENADVTSAVLLEA